MDSNLLFRKRHQIDEVPFPLRGDEEHTHLAKRNATGRARPSALLVRALLAALQGHVHGGWINGSGDIAASVDSNSRPGNHSTCYLTRDTLYIPHGSPDKATYHVGVLALVEALAHPAQAKDLLAVYAGLLASYRAQGLAEAIKPDLLRAADELYFWFRYKDQKPGESNDRMVNPLTGSGQALTVADAASVGSAAAGFTTDVDVQALTDPDRLAAALRNAQAAKKARRTPARNIFRGKVSAAIGDAIERLADRIEAVLQSGDTPMLVGSTGVGKTSAVRRLAARQGWAFEEIAGAPSFADADLVGLRLPDRDVPGVFARAFERARSGEIVLLFLDELARFNTRALDILMRPLLPTPAEVAQAMQIATDQPVRVVEVPLWGVDWAPVEGVKIVLACNPWGSSLDPALVRRVTPIEVAFDEVVADLFDKPLGDVIKASWKATAEGKVPMPIEYQALAAAGAPHDAGFVTAYLHRLAVVDKAASLGFQKIAEGLGLRF